MTTPTTTTTTSTPPHVSTALTFLSTFATLNIPLNLSLRHPTCTWHMIPASLGYPASMTNAEHEKHLLKLTELLERFPVTPVEWWEGAGLMSGNAAGEQKRGKTVSVWAKSEGVFRKEVRDDATTSPDAEWTFTNEYIFIFEFSDEHGDDTKISRVIEMLDSQSVKNLQALLERAAKNLEGRRK